jgi:fatty-acyl-CoA synthase/long-chain acyl-CoA synthetase
MNPESKHALNLRSLFQSSLERNGDRIAVIDSDNDRVKYSMLEGRANSIANELNFRGVGINDRVALLIENSIEYAAADIGCLKAGAVRVPVDPGTSSSEIAFKLKESNTVAVICTQSTVGTLTEVTDSVPAETWILLAEDDELKGSKTPFNHVSSKREDGAPPDVQPAPTDVTRHTFTGGTTGDPKGIIQTHERRSMLAYAIMIELEISQSDRLLITTQLSHAAGSFLRAALLAGASTVIHNQFNPATFLETVEKRDITWTFMVPTMIYRVLDHQGLERTDTSTIKTIAYGAAPIRPSKLRRAVDSFGPVFIQFYGQTEVPLLATTLGKSEHARTLNSNEDHLESVGKPCLMADMAIYDPETEQQVSKGSVGEILVSAPYQFAGYSNDGDHTYLGRWVRTGDIGYRDADGFLILLDRKTDVIVTGGMNVYPSRVENALVDHPDVKEVCVIGVPDDEWGEAVSALIIPDENSDLTGADIKSYARTPLSPHQRPKYIEFVSELPRTELNKIDRSAIRGRYWESEERNIH